MTRVTFDPKADLYPVWSPDGRQIAYLFRPELVPGRSTAKRRAVRERKSNSLNRPNLVAPEDWSRDGRYLLYTELDPKTGYDLWALPLEGERKPVVVLRTPFSERFGTFSPDGKWIAYESNESGRSEIYVRSFPVSGDALQVSTQGGTLPKWRADGKELYYLGADRDKIIAVGVRVLAGRFELDTPRELFTTVTMPAFLPNVPYDVTPDGRRFLVFQPSTHIQGPAPLTVALNWEAWLRK